LLATGAAWGRSCVLGIINLKQLVETDGDELHDELLALESAHESRAEEHERHRSRRGTAHVVEILPCEQIQHLNCILNCQLGVACEECEEIVVKCLELEGVLHLIRFDKRIHYESNWNRFYLLEEVLKVGQIEFSHSLILRALNQREYQRLENSWR
jgi:hypothetical protein